MPSSAGSSSRPWPPISSRKCISGRHATARRRTTKLTAVRALVTGGGGFIGSNVAKLLTDQGPSGPLLRNFSNGDPGKVGEADAEGVARGHRDAEFVSRAVRDVDVAFHLAASVGNARSIADPVDDAETNLVGTLKVLEAIRRSDSCRRIVYSSSAGVFGELKHLPIAEDHPID